MKFIADIKIQAAAGKQKRFSILAYSGGLLPVDGFDRPVIVDLSGLEVPGSIPILIDHEKSVDATLGITDSIENDGQKLTLTGVITGSSVRAMQVLTASRAGHQWQASIGARVLDQQEIPAGETVEVNGQVFTGPVIVARRSVLRETSVLPMGADATTQVNLAAKAATALKGMTAMSFEDWLISLGIDAATLQPEDMAALQLAYESKAAPAPAPPTAAAMAPEMPTEPPTASAKGATLDIEAKIKKARTAFAAEQRRIADIEAKAKGFPVIAATAIEQGWSADKVELEVLKASAAKTRPTSFRSAESDLPQMQVIEAAACLARKHKDVETAFDAPTLQAAHSQFRRGIGLQQMFLMAAAANGMPMGPGTRITTGNIREVLTYSCQPTDIQASFSTMSLPGILSNIANKEILEGYMEEDTVWRQLAQIKSATDFKTITSYRMLDDMEYEQLGPGGLIKHGKTGEESFTRSVDTFAKMYSLTRQDIINDDLGAFDDLRNRLGRGSGIKLNDLFWSTFLANVGTIFTAGRTNYIEGATTNLGTDGVGLGLGQKAWRQRRSPSGDGSKRLGNRQARYVLVPPELETIADALYTARNVVSVKTSDANTFAGKYEPIVANQLSDAAYSGYSATAWYMWGETSMGSPIVVSFLNGNETPTVEQADADFNTLGVQFRGYHDFGVDLGDGYLNALMSKGAA